LINTYSVYDFIYDIPYGTQQGKKQKDIIKKYLDNILKFKTSKGFFLRKVTDFINFLSYESQTTDLEKLYTTLSDDKFEDAFLPNRYAHRTMTCHSVKGLQFDQVIIFAEDFNLDVSENVYKYYVAVTRSKDQLIIINTSTSLARKNLNSLQKLLQTRGVSISELLTVVPDTM
jgi:superfamily I DNA/RNA helicase